MPGTVDHVEGEVFAWTGGPEGKEYDVEGLQEILKRFVGKRVSIIVEELEES